MSVKINRLEIENVKRIKAVKIEPSANGLTVIGGRNNQGKTSVLDTIVWALGGEKHRPTGAQREGSVLPPSIHITLSNGLVVERKGKNSDLKVIDPSGRKGGQQLLNEFVEQLALDLPKFMQATAKDKANTLLQIIGVGGKLAELERQKTEIYNRRQAIGRIADQKSKFAKEMPFYADAPKVPVSVSELIKQQQEILAQNGENQRKRANLAFLEGKKANLEKQIEALNAESSVIMDDLDIARKSALDLLDQSTEELENNIANIETINIKVRANLDKLKAEEDAREHSAQYDALTKEIDQIRQTKIDLLANANLPLPGLSVQDGELVFNGKKWDCMSGSEQLQVSAAIVRKLNPECGFVLLDKLEQMDLDTLAEFGQWLEQEGLQAIATRVSTGEECAIVIEDGYVAGEPATPEPETKTWKPGEF